MDTVPESVAPATTEAEAVMADAVKIEPSYPELAAAPPAAPAPTEGAEDPGRHYFLMRPLRLSTSRVPNGCSLLLLSLPCLLPLTPLPKTQ